MVERPLCIDLRKARSSILRSSISFWASFVPLFYSLSRQIHVHKSGLVLRIFGEYKRCKEYESLDRKSSEHQVCLIFALIMPGLSWRVPKRVFGICLSFLLATTLASTGDRLPEFKECVEVRLDIPFSRTLLIILGLYPYELRERREQTT